MKSLWIDLEIYKIKNTWKICENRWNSTNNMIHEYEGLCSNFAGLNFLDTDKATVTDTMPVLSGSCVHTSTQTAWGKPIKLPQQSFPC